MKVKLITPPEYEPVDTDDAKTHLHMDSDVDHEDTLVENMVKASRGVVESITNRALITQTWEFYLDEFPDDNFIRLPFGSLQSVEFVKIKNSLGEETELTATTQYLVDSSSDPGRIVLPYSVSWPSFTPYPFNAVTIRFTCGYGSPANIPDRIKSAIMLMTGDLYENRESQTIANTVQTFAENATFLNLLRDYRVWGIHE